MKRLFIYIFLFCATLLLAQKPILIEDGSVKLENFSMEYYVDTIREKSFHEIQNATFREGKNRLSLGTKAKTTWAKIALANDTNCSRKLFLHHPYAYHVKAIDFYVTAQEKILKNTLVDFDTTIPPKVMYGGSAIFSFILPPYAQRTLFIKTDSYTHQWFALEIYNEENSKRALVSSDNDISILFGVLFSLAIYNFLIFFITRTRENIYYALYLFSASVWLTLSYGLIANIFELYGLNIFKLHISLMSMPIFLLLFIITVFNTKEDYKREHKALLFILVLIVFDALYGFYDILSALKYSSTLAAVMILITLTTSISFYRKKNPLAKFFLIGHFFFIFFNAIAILYYKGLIEFNYVTSHAVGIGIMLEALMLGFILSYRIKLLEEIKKSQKALKILATTDPLTSLYNRRYFEESATECLEVAKKEQEKISVIIMDIDYFKKVNDTYGHTTGDVVLVQLALKLKEIAGESDVVCRYGGEEFVVLLPQRDLQEAERVAEGIRAAAEEIEILSEDKQHFFFTLSLGVALIDITNEESLKSAISRADEALYRAKSSGRNRVCLADG